MQAALDAFTNRCLTVVLALLYIIYPAASRVTVAMFACQQLPLAGQTADITDVMAETRDIFSGGSSVSVSYLRADYRVQCFTPLHNRFRAAGAVAFIVYPFGVPALFLWLLYRYNVPQMAKRKAEAARLQQAVRLARDCGVEPPTRDISGVPFGSSLVRLTAESIPTAYLEELSELLLTRPEEDCEGEEGDCAAGTPGGSEGGSFAADRSGRDRLEQAGSSLSARSLPEGQAGGWRYRLRRALLLSRLDDAGAGALSLLTPEERRARNLRDILRWCARRRDLISTPRLVWDQVSKRDNELQTPGGR